MEKDYDVDMMLDEGCPNHQDHQDHGYPVYMFDEFYHVKHRKLPMLFKEVSKRSDSFHRQHRTVIHLTTIMLIIVSLIVHGSINPHDWLFVGLSVLCEVK